MEGTEKIWFCKHNMTYEHMNPQRMNVAACIRLTCLCANWGPRAKSNPEVISN